MNYTQLSNIIRIYVLPSVITVGTILNLLSLVVMKRINQTAISYYMSILAIADTGIL